MLLLLMSLPTASATAWESWTAVTEERQLLLIERRDTTWRVRIRQAGGGDALVCTHVVDPTMPTLVRWLDLATAAPIGQDLVLSDLGSQRGRLAAAPEGHCRMGLRVHDGQVTLRIGAKHLVDGLPASLTIERATALAGWLAGRPAAPLPRPVPAPLAPKDLEAPS